jgi:dihydroorotase
LARYDLVIRGGEVIDPARSFRGRADIAVRDGRIAAIAPELPAAEAARALEATGCFVTPGLIDLHTHLGFELHTEVVKANDVCPPAGVTAAVDMGSTGAFTFSWYRERVLPSATPRLYAFINIASLGTIAIHRPYYVERYGRYIDEEDTARTIAENRAAIKGIKVFATSAMTGEWPLPALDAARRVADATGVPIAVHVSAAPPALDEVLARLQAGDIVTHCLNPHSQQILGADGHVLPAVRAARERGVRFDVGHGAGSFSFAVARRALDEGFLPDTISTDLYYANINGPVWDLPTTMTKFLALGMPLEEVVRRVTCNAADALGETALGRLAVGAPADIAVLSLREGAFTLVDSRKETLTSPSRLVCEATVQGGELVYEREEA